MMLPPIFPLLKSAPAVTAIVGTSPVKVYEGSAPDDAAAPYVVWIVAASAPENNLSDPPPADRVNLQVDCYHTRASSAAIRTLATAVRDALEPHFHMTSWSGPLPENETQLLRVTLQFDAWLSR